MKLRFLGTAAAEGIPGAFCRCRVCENARSQGGREIRTRSQALLDDCILIDLPPDTYMHTLSNRLCLDKIRHILVTHSHPDHLYTPELRNRKKNYAYFEGDKEPEILWIHAGESGFYAISQEIEHHKMQARCQAVPVTPFSSFSVEGYSVMPYPAAHASETSPVLYDISKDGKSLFYAHDTGYFSEETWEALKKRGAPFDLVSLDCTCTSRTEKYGHHMGLTAALSVFERLSEMKLITDHTVRVLHHFSHNGGYSYQELQEKVAPLGLLVSYDGMEIEF